MKKKLWVQTLIVVLLFLAGGLLSGQLRPETFDIGDYSNADIAALEEIFAQTQANEDLVHLVKALAWQYKAVGNETVADKLIDYGQILLDRAKAEKVDLEFVDNPDHMLQVLKIVRELGAK